MRIQFRLINPLVIVILAACVSEYVRRAFVPSLRINQPAIDLGVVHVDEIHYRTFEIENTGSRDFTVWAYSTPCPGVFERHKPLVVAKGAKEQIKVGVLIRETAISDVPLLYRYTLKTDDPAAPKMEMQLLAIRN